MLVILIWGFLLVLISSVDPDSDLALRQVHEESLNLANQVVEQSKVWRFMFSYLSVHSFSQRCLIISPYSFSLTITVQLSQVFLLNGYS
jgi:hypothetical protein